MFKSLIKAIEKIVRQQEESNRINREFAIYRIAKDREAEEYGRAIAERNMEDNKKLIEQQEQIIEITGNNVQNALDRNNSALLDYFEKRFRELESKIEGDKDGITK